MSAISWRRPGADEYAPFYAGYVARVPESDALAVLRAQAEELRRLAGAVAADRETHRYAEGKWSVREVFGHLGDAERVFGYRAFCIGRGEKKPLPGFDERAYVAAAGADRVPLAELLAELLALRAANLAFLERFDPAAWGQVGNANDTPVTTRALAFILAGHVRHHLAILGERYGLAVAAAPAVAP